MITKKTWSTKSNDWVEVNIDPKIKLTAHPDGDKMIIDITTAIIRIIVILLFVAYCYSQWFG